MLMWTDLNSTRDQPISDTMHTSSFRRARPQDKTRMSNISMQHNPQDQAWLDFWPLPDELIRLSGTRQNPVNILLQQECE